jgi:chemotaxis response regulator CheB
VANLLPPLASTFEMVAIASSAGGLKALITLAQTGRA